MFAKFHNILHCQCHQNHCPGFQSDQDSQRYPWQQTLIWCTHLSTLKSCFYHIRALGHICPNLTLDCSNNIACSRVGCRLELCQLDPRGISVKNVSWLQCLQSTLARVVTSAGMPQHLQDFADLHWLPIKWRIDYKVATLMYKLLKSGELTYLRSRIMSNIFLRSLRSSVNDRQLEPCSSRLTKVGSCAFCCAAQAIQWCLPYDIRTAPSVSICWSRLKTHYFTLAF